MGGTPDEVGPRDPKRVAYRYSAASISCSRRGASGRRSSGVRERLAGKGSNGDWRYCGSSHEESSDCKRQGCHVTGTIRSSPDAAQRRISNTRSDRVYVCCHGRWGAGYNRQTRSTTRIWEGITSEYYWERGRHERGANSSGRGSEPPPAPGQRRGNGG